MMWYPQILNMMSDYEKKVSDNEVTMCKSIVSHSNSNTSTVSIQNYNIKDVFSENTEIVEKGRAK